MYAFHFEHLLINRLLCIRMLDIGQKHAVNMKKIGKKLVCVRKQWYLCNVKTKQ